MNVFIAGLGLIDGSFAKAFKHHTDHTVFGFDINSATSEFAFSRGAIDKIADEGNKQTLKTALERSRKIKEQL